MQVVRKIHSDVTAVFRTTPKQSNEACPKERLERARAAARSPRENQALPLRGSLPLVPNKASSDAGPELAGRAAIAAMESPKALMCPLEKGVRGIEISKSSWGQQKRAHLNKRTAWRAIFPRNVVHIRS